MTPFEMFHAAIKNGNLPASVVIYGKGTGEVGVSTSPVPILGNAEAEEMAFSENGRERAELAVMACVHAAQNAVTKLEVQVL